MRTKRWIVALAATIITTGIAHAGEPVNWTGWHAGAFGGYISGKVNSNDPSHETTTGSYKDDGPTAGIYGGYRRQNAKNMVLGVDLVLPLYSFTGSAVDTVYFPGLVKYEGDPTFSVLVGAHVGRAAGKALPYLYGAVGFVGVEGRTLNVDDNDNYSPGFVQSASATHFAWQGGAGLDYQISEKMFAGIRVVAFFASRADHTMSWNSPGPNEFGYHSALVQVNLGRRF